MVDFQTTAIVILLVFALLGLLIKGFLSLRRSKKNIALAEEFIRINDLLPIGTFECTTQKNFWSPKNYNYFFETVSLYKCKNGIFVSPSFKMLGIKTYRKPFVLRRDDFCFNRKVPFLQVLEIKISGSRTYISFWSQYNTSVEISIYNPDQMKFEL